MNVNVSAWCIRNPVVPIVLFIGLMLAGMVAFSQLKVQNDPDIEFPVVVVSISQPGAAPTEITTQITQKVESAIRSVQGVRNIDASSSEGNTTVSAEFEIGDDINAAVSEVKNAVDQIRSDLPDGILEPQIFKVATSSDPIAYFAVEASDMTLEQLSWFVDDTVARRLLSVEGMASVSRNGGVNREIRIVLDPAKMQSLGVTASQINSVLRQQNVNASGGQSQIAGSRQSVRVLGNATDAFALSQTQISLGGGRSIKLADVAEVTDGFSEQRSMAFAGGKQVVTFGMSRAKGASDVTVFDNAMVKIAEIEKKLNNFKLDRTFLKVRQSGDKGMDINILRSNILKDLYERNEALIKDKDMRIALLERELNEHSFSNRQVTDIAKEAKVHYTSLDHFFRSFKCFANETH